MTTAIMTRAVRARAVAPLGNAPLRRTAARNYRNLDKTSWKSSVALRRFERRRFDVRMARRRKPPARRAWERAHSSARRAVDAVSTSSRALCFFDAEVYTGDPRRQRRATRSLVEGAMNRRSRARPRARPRLRPSAEICKDGDPDSCVVDHRQAPQFLTRETTMSKRNKDGVRLSRRDMLKVERARRRRGGHRRRAHRRRRACNRGPGARAREGEGQGARPGERQDPHHGRPQSGRLVGDHPQRAFRRGGPRRRRPATRASSISGAPRWCQASSKAIRTS